MDLYNHITMGFPNIQPSNFDPRLTTVPLAMSPLKAKLLEYLCLTFSPQSQLERGCHGDPRSIPISSIESEVTGSSKKTNYPDTLSYLPTFQSLSYESLTS